MTSLKQLKARFPHNVMLKKKKWTNVDNWISGIGSIVVVFLREQISVREIRKVRDEILVPDKNIP